MALATRYDLAEGAERAADERHARHARFLEIDRVDDAPRRGRAAVPHAADRNVGLRRHFLDEGRALGRKAFMPELEMRDPVVAPQHLGEGFQHLVGKLLAVIEEADPQSPERFRPLSRAHDGGRRSAGRQQHGLELWHGIPPPVCSKYNSVYCLIQQQAGGILTLSQAAAARRSPLRWRVSSAISFTFSISCRPCAAAFMATGSRLRRAQSSNFTLSSAGVSATSGLPLEISTWRSSTRPSRRLNRTFTGRLPILQADSMPWCTYMLMRRVSACALSSRTRASVKVSKP